MKAWQKALAVSFGAFLFFGIIVCAGISITSQPQLIHTSSTGTPQLCVPLGGSNDPCAPTTNHLDLWQEIFTAIPSVGVLILSLGLIVILPHWLAFLLRKYANLTEIAHSRYRSRIAHTRLLPVTLLQEAFSNGILHSKTFSF